MDFTRRQGSSTGFGWQVFLALLLGPCLVYTATAADLAAELHQIAQQIYIDPQAAYERLGEMAEQVQADRQLETEYYLRKAEAENLLYLYDDFESSILHGSRLLDADTPPSIRIWYAMYQCLIEQRRGDYSDAVSCLEEVGDTARQQNDTRALVFALQEAAFTRSQNEDYDAALDELKRAYGIAVFHENDFLIAITEESLGAVYGYMGDYRQSVTHNQRALDIYSRLGFKAYEAEAIYGLASTYRYWGKWQQALENYRRFDAMFAANGRSHDRFLALYGYAMTYAGTGDCKRSLEAIDKALEFSGLNDYKAELYKKQSVCMVEIGNVRAARVALDNATRMFREIPDLAGTRWELELKQCEATVLAAEGSYKEAYKVLTEYHQDLDDRTRRELQTRLEQQKMALDKQLGAWDMQLLRKQTLLDTEKIKRQQQREETQKYINLLWGLVACAFFAFIYWQGKMARRFKDLSYRDPLTHLYNRRFVFEVLEELIARASPGRGQVALMLIDIDDFKLINDTFGHQVGDRALRQLAALSTYSLRHSDTIGRIGGEEFLIILPRESPDGCRLVAERLRKTVAGTPIRAENGEKITFTVSIGLAHLDEDCHSASDLFVRADKALYLAKKSGKNCIVEYDRDAEAPPERRGIAENSGQQK